MTRWLILLIVLFATCATINAQTTIVVPAGGNLQSAIDTAKCGDKIMLQAGATYTAPADFVAYTLPVKPCTDSSYITITSSVAAPADGVRVGLADRTNMPKLVARVGSPGFFDVLNRAHHYRLSHLWFTNQRRADNSGTSYLIGGGSEINGDINNFPHHIDIDHCFFNPLEWDETGGTNLRASVNYAVEIGGSNIILRDSYMTGFGARYMNSNELLDSGCALIGTSPGPYTMDNNHCEAWFVGFFTGGGDPGSSNQATVTASTATSLTLSQTANLAAGDYISYRVPLDHPDNPRAAVWGASIVDSVSGLNVTLRIPTQVIGTNDNKRNGPPALVGTGSNARWRGWIPSDIRVTRNTFFKPRRWYDAVGTDGKGFYEIKLCDRCLIDGNTFDGRTGMTITVRNQGGAAAWSIIRNLTVSNNLFPKFSVFAATLFDDNQQLSMPSSNIRFINNLAYGDVGPDPALGIRPKVFTGQHGDIIEFDHNTILQSGEIARSGSGVPSLAPREQMTNWRWTNNITNWGTGEQHGFACLNSTNGSNEPCVPGYVWTRSVMVGAPTGPLQDARSMANFPPGNFNPATTAEVGFIDPASGNYGLRADSPYKAKGTDGKDIGVDTQQLAAHLGGQSSAPLPSPTPPPSISPTPAPTPTPVPSATPTPQPSPSPSPTVTPTPQPSPVVSPAPTPTPSVPAGKIILSGHTFSALDGGAFPWTTVVLSDVNGIELRRLQEQDNSYAFIVEPGSYQIHVEQSGYNVSPGRIHVTNATETMGGLTILNFTLGPDEWFKTGADNCVPGGGECPPGQPQPSPSVSPSPVASPTQQPTPQPSPSIEPTPVATPTPSIPSCTINAPSSVTMSRNSSSTIFIEVTAGSTPLPITITAIPTTGQVSASPRSRNAVTPNALLSFILKTKQNSSSVRFESPCGTKTTNVLIR